VACAPAERWLAGICLAASLCTGQAQTHAVDVQLAGISGNKALLVIGGQPPRFMSVGDIHAGVKLLQIAGASAKVSIQGTSSTLVLGESPVSVGPRTASTPMDNQRVVLTADSRGHFMAAGSINGKSVQFMVDTGATAVVLGEADAQRMGLKPTQQQRMSMQTANGTVVGRQLTLQRVRLGDAEVTDVTAVILPQPMPYVLLGNSFLNRFQMQRDNDQMTLQRRY